MLLHFVLVCESCADRVSLPGAMSFADMVECALGLYWFLVPVMPGMPAAGTDTSISEETAELIRFVYQEDFQRFGYDLDWPTY